VIYGAIDEKKKKKNSAHLSLIVFVIGVSGIRGVNKAGFPSEELLVYNETKYRNIVSRLLIFPTTHPLSFKYHA
jgi:hypothetical protein